MDYLPVFLRLEDAPALVVGGGRVAARKIDWLLKARARVTVAAPELPERVRRGELAHLAGPFEPVQLARVALVVAASDDRDANAAVSRAARERQIPVNV